MLLEKIKEAAESKGITISQLESETEVGKNVIYRWNKSMPSADKLLKVAKYLGTDIETLMKGEDEDE